MRSGAERLPGSGEPALQEDPGDTEPFLLVDRLSQDVVVSSWLVARLLEQLSQEL